jgi:hypothetical protein
MTTELWGVQAAKMWQKPEGAFEILTTEERGVFTDVQGLHDSSTIFIFLPRQSGQECE